MMCIKKYALVMAETV